MPSIAAATGEASGIRRPQQRATGDRRLVILRLGEKGGGYQRAAKNEVRTSGPRMLRDVCGVSKRNSSQRNQQQPAAGQQKAPAERLVHRAARAGRRTGPRRGSAAAMAIRRHEPSRIHPDRAAVNRPGLRAPPHGCGPDSPAHGSSARTADHSLTQQPPLEHLVTRKAPQLKERLGGVQHRVQRYQSYHLRAQRPGHPSGAASARITSMTRTMLVRLEVREIHADLRGARAGNLQAERLHVAQTARAVPDGLGNGLGQRRIGGAQVDVEGDQRPPCPDGDRSGGRVYGTRAVVGRALRVLRQHAAQQVSKPPFRMFSRLTRSGRRAASS